MTKFLMPLIISAGALLPSASMAADGNDLNIQYLSDHNILVRTSANNEKYILLPVQESAPMAHIRVLSDGKLSELVNIPLAESKIDYYVPLTLADRDGSNIVLDIRCNNNRADLRDLTEAIWTREIKLSDTFDTSNREMFRPLFHHTPEYGWMNDPNGMFYKDGVWHLAFQWNPYGSKWENLAWGHSTSEDLINWHAESPVLYRDDLGMVFSGSAVVDKDNTAGFGKDAVVALFTSADASQTQSLAYSTDNGYTYTRFEGNPVIAYHRESRDPNMFWDESGKRWVLMLASALDGEMLIFTSPDLKEWTLQSKFGRDYGAHEGVWECPDLLKLPVLKNGIPTGRDKWVLICNINPGGPFGGSAAQYFVGDFDGNKFVAESAPEVTKWMDYGKDFYAAVSFSNAPEGRHPVIGWMSNWQYANDVPTLQYRSANTIVRDLSLFEFNGETYLASVPAREMDSVRGNAIKGRTGKLNGKGIKYTLPKENSGICEIAFDVEISGGATVEAVLSNSKGEKVTMTLNAGDDTFSMDRRASGITDFSEHFPAVTTAPAYNGTGRYCVRLFIDRNSIEAFDASGRFAMTNLVFPNESYDTLTISAPDGNATLHRMNIYPILIK